MIPLSYIFLPVDFYEIRPSVCVASHFSWWTGGVVLFLRRQRIRIDDEKQIQESAIETGRGKNWFQMRGDCDRLEWQHPESDTLALFSLF